MTALLVCCGGVNRHNPGCRTLDTSTLPWHCWLVTRRCRAVLEPAGPGSHYGRCELARHPRSVDHALERGFETPRWSTRRTS